MLSFHVLSHCLFLYCVSFWVKGIDSLRLRSPPANRSTANRSRPHVVGTEDLLGSFRIQNRATVPVNLLALSAAIRLHGHVCNTMAPDVRIRFTALLAWYELHLTISETNVWDQDIEVAKGLAKNATGWGASSAVGAGVTGSLGAKAGIAVAGILGALIAPPIAIGVGILAAGTVGITSSLAVSQIVEHSADFTAIALEKLMREKQELPEDARIGDEWYPFLLVVEAADVRRAYLTALALEGQAPEGWVQNPTQALSGIVMTRETAEAYYTALHVKFSTQKLATNHGRELEIIGGFSLPQPIRNRDDIKFVEFKRLHISEATPDFGCNADKYYQNTKTHWRDKYDGCEYQCSRDSSPQDCISYCQRILKDPREAELALFGREESLGSDIHYMLKQAGFWTRRLFVSTDETAIMHASRAAGLPEKDDAARLQASGQLIAISGPWHHMDFTATVAVTATFGSWKVDMPLEVILDPNNGTSVFTERDRAEFQALRYGECWSRNPDSYVNRFREVVAAAAWCHANKKAPHTLHFGLPCLPHQSQCGKVEPDSQFYCVDGF